MVATALSSNSDGGFLAKAGLVQGDRILLVGDSLAQALGPPLSKLAAEAGFEFSYDATQGTRVEQWGENGRAEGALQRSGASVVLISLGTNDAVTNAAFQERFPGRAADLVARMKALGARLVVWVVPPTMPFSTDAIVAGIQASGAQLFDSRALEIPRVGDRIHPTIAGSAGWAAALFETLR